MEVIVINPRAVGLMVRPGKSVEVSAQRGQRWIDAGWAKAMETLSPEPDPPKKKSHKKKP